MANQRSYDLQGHIGQYRRFLIDNTTQKNFSVSLIASMPNESFNNKSPRGCRGLFSNGVVLRAVLLNQ
jgi:hypothetical protein